MKRAYIFRLLLLLLVISAALLLPACDEQGGEQNDNPSHVHNYNVQKADSEFLQSEATCTQAALYCYSCTCGAKGTETFAYGEYAPHAYADTWTSDEMYHWHACQCGAENDKAQHTFVDDRCACGYQKEHTHTYATTYSYDGTYHWYAATCGCDVIMLGKYNGTAKDVIIPATYQGKPVTSIGDDAFYRCTDLTSVICAENSQLESIGEDAFSYCTGLTSIEIPSSVKSIEKGAFSNCRLTTITFEENSQLENIGYAAFFDCKRLASIEIPSSVTYIGSSVFDGCANLVYTICENAKYLGNAENPYVVLMDVMDTSIATFSIPANTKIIYNAFWGCTKLTSVEIPSNVKGIGQLAFYDCTGLTSIEIPSSVTSIGYMAFENCTGLTHIEIPNSVTSIGDRAFSGCTGLTSVTFVENSQLESIGEWMFKDCTELTSIEIPSSVTSIGNNAFYDCTRLTSIIYGGTIAQWAVISATGLDLVECEIRCTDGTLSFVGRPLA